MVVSLCPLPLSLVFHFPSFSLSKYNHPLLHILSLPFFSPYMTACLLQCFCSWTASPTFKAVPSSVIIKDVLSYLTLCPQFLAHHSFSLIFSYWVFLIHNYFQITIIFKFGFLTHWVSIPLSWLLSLWYQHSYYQNWLLVRLSYEHPTLLQAPQHFSPWFLKSTQDSGPTSLSPFLLADENQSLSVCNHLVQGLVGCWGCPQAFPHHLLGDKFSAGSLKRERKEIRDPHHSIISNLHI